jgi:ribosomal protein S16
VSRWAADGGAVSRWGADGIALSERTHDLHEGAVSRWAADGIALSERTHDLHGRTGAVSRWAADGIALSERTHDLHEGAVSRWAADGIALSERTHDLHGRTGAARRGLTRAARSFPRPPSAPLKWKVGTHLDRGWARWGAHPMQDVPAAVKAALTRASSVANTQRSVRKPSVKTRYRAVVLDDSAADSVGSEQAVGCRLVCASKGDRHALATTTCWPHVLGVVSDIHEDLLGDICASELPE